MVIYKITNIKTGDIYIGSAVDFNKRKYAHLYFLKKGNHHSAILQNSYNKHGKDLFEFSIVETVDDKIELVPREQHWIDTLCPRYNISKTAGSPLGVKHTIEARINMSKAHLGKKLSQETISKRTKKVLGAKRSQFTRDKMRCSSKKYPVKQLSLCGNFIKDWESAQEASKSLGIIPSHITSCCKGRYGRKSIGGFKWKYK
jgi:group I intron endonuclease